MKPRRVLFGMLWAVCWMLQAALILWFWPVMLQDWLSGKWDQRDRMLRRHWNRNKRRLFDEWARKENEKRRKRVWKNRNNFYK